jgi:tyrosyl-tRNA synthetase
VVVTMPLLEGTDGVRKMSKSLDNWVGLSEPPDEQFGKLMSIPDELIAKYLRLVGAVPPSEAERVEAGLADGSLHPNEEKRAMARSIVDLYYEAGAGEAAERRFDLVHKEHEVPADVEEAALGPDAFTEGRVWLPRLIVAAGLATSNAEARRAVQQGGVKLDGAPLSDPDADLASEDLHGKVLQVGKRRFVRLRTR